MPARWVVGRGSSIRLFVYSSIRLFVYSSIRLFVYSSIRLFVYSSIRLFVYSSIRLFVLSRILNRVREFAGDVFELCGVCDFIAIFTYVKGIDSAVCLCANAGGVDVEAKV